MRFKAVKQELIVAIIAPPIVLFLSLGTAAAAFFGTAEGAMPLIMIFVGANLIAMIVIGLPVHFILRKIGAADGPNYSFFAFVGGALTGAALASLGYPLGNGTMAADGKLYMFCGLAGGVWGLISLFIALQMLKVSDPPDQQT